MPYIKLSAEAPAEPALDPIGLLTINQLLSELNQYRANQNKYEAAVATLEGRGYTYCGGQLWRPPAKSAPDFTVMDFLGLKCEILIGMLADYRIAPPDGQPMPARPELVTRWQKWINSKANEVAAASPLQSWDNKGAA